MKTHYIKNNAAAALVCLGLGMLCWATASHAASKKSEAPAQASGDMAKLVIVRTASVGSGIAATIALDGKDLVNLTQGISYRGALSAGKHVISVTPHPNLSGQSPTKTEFTAEKGHTYSFKVGSKSGKVMLEQTP
jgi:hypothetical protein